MMRFISQELRWPILPADIRHELLNFLKTSDTLFAFDSNYRPALWGDAQEARKTINSFWEISDLALPSLDDEMELFQESFETVQKRFAAYGSLGALKRGEKGPLSLGGADLGNPLPGQSDCGGYNGRRRQL
jgi:2-dehydro-3-deoxygluconokinase